MIPSTTHFVPTSGRSGSATSRSVRVIVTSPFLSVSVSPASVDRGAAEERADPGVLGHERLGAGHVGHRHLPGRELAAGDRVGAAHVVAAGVDAELPVLEREPDGRTRDEGVTLDPGRQEGAAVEGGGGRGRAGGATGARASGEQDRGGQQREGKVSHGPGTIPGWHRFPRAVTRGHAGRSQERGPTACGRCGGSWWPLASRSSSQRAAPQRPDPRPAPVLRRSHRCQSRPHRPSS